MKSTTLSIYPGWMSCRMGPWCCHALKTTTVRLGCGRARLVLFNTREVVSRSIVRRHFQVAVGLLLSCYPLILSGKMSAYKIVMVRHGESEWNLENRFCGWFDANLSEKGLEEARNGGHALKDANYKFDVAHTSLLTRAQVTLDSVLEIIEQKDIPIHKTWRLNERHYGGN